MHLYYYAETKLIVARTTEDIDELEMNNNTITCKMQNMYLILDEI